MVPSSKLQAYIGFSIKARKIVYGYDNVLTAKHLGLVLAQNDINRTAKSELERYCQARQVPLHWCDEELMQLCVHRVGCKCIGLTDASLSNAANRELDNIRRE